MNPINSLRTWWQKQTGEEDTPFDGDAPVWLISMLFHLVLMVVLAFTVVGGEVPKTVMNFVAPLEEQQDELELTEQFQFSDQVAEQLGANSVEGTEMALAVAPEVADFSVVPSPTELAQVEIAPIEINEMFDIARGLQFDNLPVKGSVGEGTTGAEGAIDRITHEILLSLEERPTQVVWLFDQSGSLTRQRAEIHDRFDRIYDELGIIQASGNEAFTKHQDKPLLTSVVAFGNAVKLMTKKPTDNIAEIKKAVSDIERDDTGTERVFSAVYMATDWYKNLRTIDPRTKQPERNVMIIVITDEVGDDQDGLDQTIKMCRRYQVPVYVVGVPAPFGRKETMVKWVDPDPAYDQTPQWAPVTQGPESFLPERIKLSFSAESENDPPIDSGFGPYALTRLAYETGGIFFAVHPNRSVSRQVSRRDTADFSAHIETFFDPEVMRQYRPDYVSTDEYWKRVSASKARTSLIQAAQMSWLTPMEDPQTRFEKRDEASFVNALSEAQKMAAKLEPKLQAVFDTLKLGEGDRDKETSLRWQAGYDLAMGRATAVKVRTEGYNAMLADAKRGLKFKNEKNNTWILKPSDEISTGSQTAKAGEKAKEYLERVVHDHPGTPWALLAKRELDQPLGWTWTEEFTAPPPPRNANPGDANANPAPAADEKAMMLKKPPMKRRPPPL